MHSVDSAAHQLIDRSPPCATASPKRPIGARCAVAIGREVFPRVPPSFPSTPGGSHWAKASLSINASERKQHSLESLGGFFNRA